ncbi:hypothetical protein CRYUN_Cryun19dG0112400 [Craigia yunnanensis]
MVFILPFPLAQPLRFDAVIHFAGLKAVGESVQKPLLYYDNKLIGTITLLEVMAAHGCKNLFIEEICRDIRGSDSEWKIILLRYFNPVGAHPSGYIGEDPRGIPNNLMPFVQQVAVGRRPALTMFGNDYSTKDGTGVVTCEVYNLGTGKGTSVLEMVAAFEKASGKKIPLEMAHRRPGDAEIVYASTKKALRELNWKAKYGIEEMCRDLWNWPSKNPYGYGSPDSKVKSCLAFLNRVGVGVVGGGLGSGPATKARGNGNSGSMGQSRRVQVQRL